MRVLLVSRKQSTSNVETSGEGKLVFSPRGEDKASGGGR